MFCVVDSSKHETSVISYHLVRWGGGGEGEGLGGTHGFQGKRRVLVDQSSPTEY